MTCAVVTAVAALLASSPARTPGALHGAPFGGRRSIRCAAAPIPVVVKNIDRTAQAFPSTLSSDDGDLQPLRQVAEARTQLEDAAVLSQGIQALDLVAAGLFGVVLWFGVLNDVLFPRAARPSDLVLPRLGRLLGYSAEKDAWLDDFENGSRGEYPSALLAFGIPLFYAAGLLLETGIRLAFTGPADEASGFCCQLGVIGCIWAGVYEIGRIETGDALKTREEDQELDRVWSEFQQFADARLERVSETYSINQIEVIRAFRRFHARHRSMDFEGSATDVLIAENFRRWYLSGYPYFDANLGIVISRPPTPTAAGFFKGVKLKEVPF